MSAQRDAFIAKYKSDVIATTCGTGIFPSVKMVQMLVEGADSKGVAGNGITFVKANNAFGIKADASWKGEKMAFNTPKDGKPVSYFRVYPSIRDSIADHTRFLQVNSRYKNAGVFDAKTPEAQLIAIGRAGYSESPTYASTLITMINAYGLKKLDEECQKKKLSIISQSSL